MLLNGNLLLRTDQQKVARLDSPQPTLLEGLGKRFEDDVGTSVSHPRVNPGDINAIGSQPLADGLQKVAGVKLGRAEVERCGYRVNDEGILFVRQPGKTNGVVEPKLRLGPGLNREIMPAHPVEVLQDGRINLYTIHPVKQQRHRPGCSPASNAEYEGLIGSRRKQR